MDIRWKYKNQQVNIGSFEEGGINRAAKVSPSRTIISKKKRDIYPGPILVRIRCQSYEGYVDPISKNYDKDQVEVRNLIGEPYGDEGYFEFEFQSTIHHNAAIMMGMINEKESKKIIFLK